MNNINRPNVRRKFFSVFSLFALLAANFGFAFSQINRGAGNVQVKTSNGQTKDVKLYDGSYALVIGNSNYQYWDNLPGVKSDVEAVKNALTTNGFTVETAQDLKSRELSDRIEQFVSDYGYSKNNRLLIYYAGHGHTQKTIDDADERELGFIVPVDTPLPDAKDLSPFFRKAVSLEKIRTFAREIQAKHALFLFDSCFSGKLVSRSNIAVPPIVEESVTYAVRQFITAGAANQPVPDESIFRRAFVRALEGDADSNKDGYVLGTELAAYLRDKVSNASRRTQTPQYGVIDDIALDRGDFVFTVTGKTASAPDKTEPSKPDAPIAARSRGEIEREAWSYIKDGTDAQDFRDFLKEFPDGVNAGNAKIKLEQAVWDAVKDSRDKARIQSYLNEFPTGTNAFLAKTKLRQLETAANTPTAPSNTTGNNSAAPTKGTIRKNAIGMELVYIPAGDFMMGSPASETDRSADEGPQRKITIREGFWMGKFEVTQAQYEAVTETNPSNFKNCPQCPVEQVSWDDAKAFIQKMNAKNDGFVYSLPSEAEWEYAARAGTTTTFAFGNSLSSSQANFNGNYPYGGAAKGQYLEKTVAVGSYQPNAFGLYDMHGNVWEWVEDIYNKEGYANLPTSGAANVSVGDSSYRVLRGGSWNINALNLRSGDRYWGAPSNRFGIIGFRVAARPRLSS